MLWRAIATFIALPGVVAFGAPLAWAWQSGMRVRFPVWGGTCIALGTALLLACVREFYIAGRGTLAPWAPPIHLVTTGPYRFTRNPMYVSVAAILAGWAALYGSRPLLVYALAVICACHFRVILAEEPRAEHDFGANWQAYRKSVPRWLALRPR
jgi:protein-S-isoprenylcysteine O-methyltransferase Ste14